MFIGTFYFDIPNTFPSLTMTSIYFITFIFVVFMLSRTYRSFLRPFVLLVANLVFLWPFSSYDLIAILVLAVLGYLFGLLLAKKKNKSVLTVEVACYLLCLIFFKYNNFFLVDNIVMPLGLSFYSFKIISYLFDIYRDKCDVEKNLLYYLDYVMFFPTIMAGPINRAKPFLDTIKAKPEFDYQDAKSGAFQMLLGIFEKKVFCDYIGIIVNNILASEVLFGTNVLLGVVLYSFQIYLDFDALSNIAIGTARLLGFRIPKNFNSPYVASNLNDFWRRWHISLSSWFRDYLYIPLGGNRKGNVRRYINLIIVFVVSGIWHGSTWNFVIWGLLHGIIQTIEMLILKPFKGKEVNKVLKPFIKVFGIIINFTIVTFLWLIFKCQTMTEVMLTIERIMTSQAFDYELIGMTINEVYWLIFIIVTVIITDILRDKFDMLELFNKQIFIVRWLTYAVLLVLFIVFGVYGGVFTASDFIYQFF